MSLLCKSYLSNMFLLFFSLIFLIFASNNFTIILCYLNVFLFNTTCVFSWCTLWSLIFLKPIFQLHERNFLWNFFQDILHVSYYVTWPEAALQRWSWEKVFWEYAANLQENIRYLFVCFQCIFEAQSYYIL